MLSILEAIPTRGTNFHFYFTISYPCGRKVTKKDEEKLFFSSLVILAVLRGKNAVQVGLGATVASITRIHSQGSIQNTDKNTDVA
ncbi:MAG TPA: hypothetical protein EYP74_02710, partial [Anaerolineales bacterium]|nr:hypothetical protein [Anaerolineales bacterium]